MRKALLTILAAGLLVVAGCGGGSSSTSDSSSDSSTTTDETSTTAKTGFKIEHSPPPTRLASDLHPNAKGLVGPEPKPIIPNRPPPDQVYVAHLIDGIGPIGFRESRVTIQYVGAVYESGKKFESSWEQGRPYTFDLGKGEILKPVETAIENMETGDRREIVIPPKLAFGSKRQGSIPPNSTVVFVVDLLKVESAKEAAERRSESKESGGERKKSGEAPSRAGGKPAISVPKGPPPKQLVKKDLKIGSGPAAKPGDEVTMHYVGVLYDNGQQFDASWDRGEPFTFKLGKNLVIQGWEKGIPGMKVGGRRELIIPPNLAYGSQGGGTIPPNSTLIFVVDLLKID